MVGVGMIVEYDENVDFIKGKVVFWFLIFGCFLCRFVEVFMKELSEEFGEIVIVYVNVEKWSGLVEGFRILNVLMFVYFKDGKEVVW